MESTRELLERLNISDECTTIEAKRATNIHRSILETVCAFANEPGLGGGTILLGVERDEYSLFPSYTVCGVENPDKLQLDLSTQCADMFNLPIRPEISIDRENGKIVMNVFIPELHSSQKPLYFKKDGLPKGAYRRIGSSDQRCTDDDLFVFYNTEDSLDSTVIRNTSMADISESALATYRSLRSNINPYAEELQYSDEDLLSSLGCTKKEGKETLLTYCGLLVFGTKQALRRILPMVRVDYIRVPGNVWVEDPEKRFVTVDMRGSLIELLQRTFSAIADDLPKGFLLPEGQIQADSIGLPSRVLREALVNAFIHRTYRENQPIQIIRYGNRIEIKNPGFSLKPEEQLGEPGSKNRNPFIAAIFHDTNLAETKGSGIRTMRSLMERAALMPPTFESDHSSNQFTTRLLLHHFLNEEDLIWLEEFKSYNLDDSQKRALIFVKEAGAVDNAAHRQLNGMDTLHASADLRGLRDKNILLQKGKGRTTYYVPDPSCPGWRKDTGLGANTNDKGQLSISINMGHSEPVQLHSEPVPDLSEPDRIALVNDLPEHLRDNLSLYTGRVGSKEELSEFICDLCRFKEYSIRELSLLLGKGDKYLLSNFIKPLRDEGRLEYTYPEMPNHPNQAYRSSNN